MIKVFTTNNKGKIEITKDELQRLLDESYWEGYNNGKNSRSWVYTTPYYTTANGTTITCNNATTESHTIRPDTTDHTITIGGEK